MVYLILPFSLYFDIFHIIDIFTCGSL